MERVPVKEKFSYGLGDMASCIVFTLTTALSTYFYTNVVGLSAAVIGTILFNFQTFDGVSDIIIGILVDKTKSRHGKSSCMAALDDNTIWFNCRTDVFDSFKCYGTGAGCLCIYYV